MRRRELRIETETRPAHSLQQKFRLNHQSNRCIQRTRSYTKSVNVIRSTNHKSDGISTTGNQPPRLAIGLAPLVWALRYAHRLLVPKSNCSLEPIDWWIPPQY